MKKRPNKTAKHAPRTLGARELQTILGGDGLAGNPGTPGTDGGLAQMEQMMDQQ